MTVSGTVTSGDVRTLVAALTYKAGWSFKVGGPGGRFLCVSVLSADSLAPTRNRVTQHMFEVPAGTGFQELARWAFGCVLQAELHEAAEWFSVDGFRPHWPHHQDEGSPYELVDRWESPP